MIWRLDLIFCLDQSTCVYCGVAIVWIFTGSWTLRNHLKFTSRIWCWVDTGLENWFTLKQGRKGEHVIYLSYGNGHLKSVRYANLPWIARLGWRWKVSIKKFPCKRNFKVLAVETSLKKIHSNLNFIIKNEVKIIIKSKTQI